MSTANDFAYEVSGRQTRGTIGDLLNSPDGYEYFSWVHPLLMDAEFPTPIPPSLGGARLEEIQTPYAETLARLRSIARRPGDAAESLYFTIETRALKDRRWIWVLGQLHRCPASPRAIVFGRQAEVRFATLGSLEFLDPPGCSERLSPVDHFLVSFPMTAEERDRRDAEDAAAGMETL